ncbi:PPA1309 family protein [Kytococcus sedentarius]|uniref:PPA1309 family protein n=1 Tax=Kytococcus sedentarius TaxID=1276 RepID=UPI003879BBB8
MTDDATQSTPTPELSDADRGATPGPERADLPHADLLQVAQETEQHVAADGWGQRERVFALVPTADLVAAEPSLADALAGAGRYSSIEQELPEGVELEEYLGRLAWPRSVTGCALAVERLRAAPAAEGETAGEASDAASGGGAGDTASGTGTEPVRLLVVATREGERFTLVRFAAHDSDDAVAVGAEVGTDLQAALGTTLEG